MKGGRSEGGVCVCGEGLAVGGGDFQEYTEERRKREREYLEGGKEGELWKGGEGSRCNGAKNEV